jgi:hypothetical protein
LGRLLDQPCSEPIHLFIDGLFNLRQGRFWMRCSPLRHGGERFLCWLLPLLVQVFWVHVGFSLLGFGNNSFPLRQSTTLCLSSTTPAQQANGAKK